MRVDSPVPAPEGLLAEAWVRGPDAAWSRIQHGVGGALALLPPTMGALACAYAGLEAPLAPLIDGKGTSYVVLGDGGAEQSGEEAGELAAHWVMALPLTDPVLASATLFGRGDAGGGIGAGVRHTVHDVAGMRALSGAGIPRDPTVALAVGARAWLVLASSDEDLARLGPYAVRTMPAKEAPPGSAPIVADVPPSALAGALSSWLGARWGETRAWLEAKDQEQRAKHGGRAPDFGDPRPVLEVIDGAVKRRVALLAQARGARVTIDPGDDEVHAELTVDPGSDAASTAQLAAMVAGDAHPLAASPADATLAMMVRDDAKGRNDDAATLQVTLDRALGDRLREDDSRAVHRAITDWMHARGDWWTAAAAWGTVGGSRGLWLTTPAASPEAASHALRELVDLSHRRVFQAFLASALHLSPAWVTLVDAPPLGKVSLATFAEDGAGARSPVAGGALGVAWGVQDKAVPGELLVAAGPGAPQLLSTEAEPPGRLGDDPRSARALDALGNRASFALVVQPLRLEAALGGSPAGESAPLVAAWGRDGGRAWARVELADAVLRELLRQTAGL